MIFIVTQVLQEWQLSNHVASFPGLCISHLRNEATKYATTDLTTVHVLNTNCSEQNTGDIYL